MRLSIILPIVASLLTASLAASAQNTPFGNGSNAKSTDSGDDEQEDPDKPIPYYQRKAWFIGASFETNHLIVQQDVGKGKSYNTLNLNAAYNVTKRDQVRVSGGFAQYFYADETETGIRNSDIRLGYNHRFSLPWEMTLAPSVSNAFPTSFAARNMSLIALPSAGIFLMRNFLDSNLSVSVNGGGSYYIVKYRQAVGQIDANTQFSTYAGLSLNYSLPFLQALQVTAQVGTSWTRSYDVDHANDATIQEQFKNQMIEPSADQYAATQSWQQQYSGEIDLSYNLPSLVGVNSTLQVSVSQGDGVLRDGATHLYWLSRRGGLLAASLTVSY